MESQLERKKLPCITSPTNSSGVEDEGVGTRTRNLGIEETASEINKYGMENITEQEYPLLRNESNKETEKNDTVLFLGGMPHPREYDYFVNSFQGNGTIRRIRQSKNNDKTLSYQDGETWNCTIWFDTTKSLKEAILNKEKLDECKPSRISTFQERNVKTLKRDHIPESFRKQQKKPRILQKKPKWFVGRSRGGKKQCYKIYKYLREKIGPVDDVTIKQYGRGVLIKAEDELQREILIQMASQENEDETLFSFAPHRTFNSTKGIIHDNEFKEMNEHINYTYDCIGNIIICLI